MSENTNEVYLLEAEILRLKTSLAAAQARAERAEGALAEARKLLEGAAIALEDEPVWMTEYAPKIRTWLAHPHGERAQGT